MFGQINGVVAPALESCPGRDSICLDLCLNLNPDPASLPAPLHCPPLLLRPTVPPSSSSFLVLWRRAPGRGSPAAERSQARAPPPTRPVPAAVRKWPGLGAEGTAEIASSCQSQRAYPPPEDYLEDMEERSAETNSNVDSSAQPSVAQLAGRFREQAEVARETPASKPTRRKPPCSLPLFPPKVELGQNGEEKSPSSTSHPPKIKVKSSPLIEKLQANLAFDPAALLPGASPKSPGLKAIVSPFHSPPSTPSSPGIRSQSGEAEEIPVSFDQPPEGTHLPSYNKVRTRGSIKRRPPSRRFRRSQSDCGDLGDYRAVEPSQENGTREENGDDVFPSKSKAPGSPPPNQEALGDGIEGTLGSAEKLPRRSNSTEKPEEQVGTPEEAKAGEKAGHNPDPASQGSLEALVPPQTCSTEAKNGRGSPLEGTAAGECTDTGKATEGTASEESVADEEEGAVREKAPQSSSGRVEDAIVPELETKQKALLEPRVDNIPVETSNETQNDREVSTDDIPIEDTRM